MTQVPATLDHPELLLAAVIARAQTMRIGALNPDEIRGALFAMESLQTWLAQLQAGYQTDGADRAVQLLDGLTRAMQAVLLRPQAHA